MLSAERQKAIIDSMKQKGSAIVTELATLFQVTEETIRRDLQKLETKGLVVRTHGGAVLYDDSLLNLSTEIRETLNKEGKMAIAKEAAKHIQTGDILFLDASTTVFFLAKEIKAMQDITVITNSLRIINELIANEKIEIVCIGGSFNAINKSFVGKNNETNVGTYAANKCFLSCNGILPEVGILEKNPEEAFIKKIMCENSGEVIVLCDKTKLGRARLNIVAPVERANLLITDSDKANDIISKLVDKGLEVKLI
ncbi:MAG: DeoR/GlpR family DNA-binding transcription regulator [Bacillota bacterium]